ncbi:MAG: hypothetical protein MJK08_13690 [Campylobacterales bacterium]|nr:hypothetical protein [Campylobacterales bacterium]NQY53735.1 hypothetical protein [Campylobacteraceae bacterium]
MNQNELNEARTNPEFLTYLDKTRVDAIKTKNIEALYEVLDTMLILDLDENEINTVYEHILTISFDEVDKIVNNGNKLSLDNKDLYLVRSFYEHAIEKWSNEQLDAAQQLFFVLSNIICDNVLIESLNVHVIAIAKGFTLDKFYDEKVNINATPSAEKYAYFIDSFNFETGNYLKENKDILAGEFEKLKHLLD